MLLRLKSLLFLLTLIGCGYFGQISAITLSAPTDCKANNCQEMILTTSDGIKIQVQEWKKTDKTIQNNPSAPVLILSHGFPHSHQLFLELVQSDMANKYRLITYDARGQGFSDKPTPETVDIGDGQLLPIPQPHYTNERFSMDIDELITAFNQSSRPIGKPFLLFNSLSGLRFSGFAELKGAGNLSDTIKGVILQGAFTKADLLNPNFDVLSVLTPQALQINGLLALPSNVDLGLFVQANQQFAKLSFSQPVNPDRAAQILAVMMLTPQDVRLAIATIAVDNSVLAGVDIPVLITHGKKDLLVQPSHAVDNSKLIPNAQLILYPELGHQFEVEKPAKVIKDIEAFIDKNK